MKKDSTNTYERVMNLAEQLALKHETTICISFEVWAGGPFLFPSPEFRIYVKEHLSRIYKTLKEAEAEVLHDSVT